MIKTLYQAIKKALTPKVDNREDKGLRGWYNSAMEKDYSKLEPGAETGVRIKQPDPKAWMAGGETGIAKVVLEVSGQYDDYLPDEENQSFYTPARFDTMSCATFSATNNVETLLNRMRAKGQLSKKQEDFLINKGYINPQTNKVNFSDRFTAKMSGTTRDGNYLEAVGDSIRECEKGGHGLVPESAWPMPDWDSLDGKSQSEIWAIYMAEPTQEVKNLGKEFLKYFKVSYQWVAIGSSTPADLRYALAYGPFQIAAKVCSPWNSTEAMPPIKACGCGGGHATLIYGYKTIDGKQPFKDFDHYRSFRKFLAEDYCIPWAFQYAIEEKTETTELPLNYAFRIQLKYGMAESVEVRAMQKALQTLKDQNGKPFMTVGVFGPFGPQTKNALGRFQSENGITDPDGQGTNFGPQTRAAMNKKLLAIT